MYHFFVRRTARSIWNRINAGDLDAPWRVAVEDLHFTFVGATRLGCDVTGRDAFRDWLRGFVALFNHVQFEVEDVASAGWPWRTRVSVRLLVRGESLGGDAYDNVASQWITLRWGRMTEDWVVEDTMRLERLLSGDDRAHASQRR